MKEMMKRLNVVKYATSEEQKKKLAEKGFKPVKEKKPGKGKGEKAGSSAPGSDGKGDSGGDGNA